MEHAKFAKQETNAMARSRCHVEAVKFALRVRLLQRVAPHIRTAQQTLKHVRMARSTKLLANVSLVLQAESASSATAMTER